MAGAWGVIIGREGLVDGWIGTWCVSSMFPLHPNQGQGHREGLQSHVLNLNLVQSLTTCVTLREWHNLSVPQILLCQMNHEDSVFI